MINNILVPVDGSECAMRAAQYAAELAKFNPNSKVTVFTVDRIPRSYISRRLYWVAADWGEQGKHIREVFAEERQRILEQAEAVFKEKGINVQSDYGAGNPAEEISEYARKHGVDLIVMGTRGMSNLKEIFLGSVSHKVLQMAPCPVILIK
ncbi:MAG: universal stress protein [Peptococcaceae bacterium]|nr:universal stress protein [Peptococcaceae bacterium]